MIADDGKKILLCFHSYISAVPIPDDKAVAMTLSEHDLKSSTVDNFFHSDDSSEGKKEPIKIEVKGQNVFVLKIEFLKAHFDLWLSNVMYSFMGVLLS